MPNLEDLYNSSTNPTVIAARQASEGKKEVNAFDVTSQFQDNFTARTPGDTNVLLGNNASDNNGTFTDKALEYYAEEALKLPRPASFKPDTPYKEWTPSKKYSDENSASPGIVYRS